jgi:hypothetical protein
MAVILKTIVMVAPIPASIILLMASVYAANKKRCLYHSQEEFMNSYKAKFIFDGDSEDADAVKKYLSEAVTKELEIEDVYGVEISDYDNEKENEWIICYTRDGNDIWETVLGEDAMQIRVGEIVDETGMDADDIVVFNKSDEFK